MAENILENILIKLLSDLLENYGILPPYNDYVAIIFVCTFVYLLRKEGPELREQIRTSVTNYIKKQSNGYCVLCN